MLSPEFQEFFDSLGPTELDQSREQTRDQAIATAAGSFMAACQLEFGKAPSIADAEEAVRSRVQTLRWEG